MSSITIEYDGANIGKHTLNKHKGLLEQEGHGFECRNYVLLHLMAITGTRSQSRLRRYASLFWRATFF